MTLKCGKYIGKRVAREHGVRTQKVERLPVLREQCQGRIATIAFHYLVAVADERRGNDLSCLRVIFKDKDAQPEFPRKSVGARLNGELLDAGCRGQAQRKHGFAGLADDINIAAALTRNAGDRRQPKARTLADVLGCEERLEDLAHELGWDARTVVLNGKQRPAVGVIAPGGINHDSYVAGLVDGVTGVDHEIVDELLEL